MKKRSSWCISCQPSLFISVAIYFRVLYFCEGLRLQIVCVTVHGDYFHERYAQCSVCITITCEFAAFY